MRWIKTTQKGSSSGRSDTLQRFDDNPNDFLDRLVTGVKNGSINSVPKIKISRNSGWRGVRRANKIQIGTFCSVEKAMIIIFWDAQNVILVDILQGQKQSLLLITKEFYENCTTNCWKSGAEKRSNEFSSTMTECHLISFEVSFAREFRWELRLLVQRHCTVPTWLYRFSSLFQSWKNKGNRWESVSETKQAVIHRFASQDDTFYRKGLERWRHCMLKCFNSNGDYVEK